MAKLDEAFNIWIQSGSTSIPPLVQRKIAERVAFHTTKALVSGIFLVVFVALTTLIWRTLVKRSSLPQAKWRLLDSALLVCGVAGVTFSLLLLVIVVANMQGAFAPIAMTLFYG
jgi:glucan phosphoethanolaminetransferase (alkaline phosphatase superfamily)